MRNKAFSLCRAIFLLLLAAHISGCIQRAVIYPDGTPEKILLAVSGTVAEDEVLSAMAQIDVVTPQSYHPVKAALIMRKPLYLRLELLPIIGTPDFFLTTSLEGIRILIPSKGEFYHGKATRANLARFLPWQFDIEELVMILTGTYPMLKEKDVFYQSYLEKNSLRIEIGAQSRIYQILWIGENNRLLKLVRINETGKEIYNVKYEGYGTDIPIPQKITITMADGVNSISVKYSDLKIEKATDLSIFDLPKPEGVKSISLD